MHVTYQICDALAYCHSQMITHRDLKPENILLTSDVPPIVKVADFGLAKAVDSYTMLKTMCGTPSYLAPEVVRQQLFEGYDSQVDSWSIGVILFSMLTNTGPFVEDMDQPDIRIRVNNRTIDWSGLLKAEVSGDCRDFNRKLLIEDPNSRMTMKDALLHPWLRTYRPFYINSSHAGYMNCAHVSALLAESSVNLDESETEPDLPLDVQEGPSQQRAPLQRRSDVLSQAAEGNGVVPEPSWEMLQAAGQEAGPSNRHGKRVRAELSPMMEEEDIGSTTDTGENGNGDMPPRRSARNKQARHK